MNDNDWQSYAEASAEHRDLSDVDVVIVVHAAQGWAELHTLRRQGRDVPW